MLKHLLRGVYGAINSDRTKLQIFIYHRVLPEPDVLFPDIVDGKAFAAQMEWIRDCFCVLPLNDAVESLFDNTLPRRAACITFDDGYADNVEIALPILQRYELPATFFIASDFLDGGRMWNDSVIEAVRRYLGEYIDLGALGLGKHSVVTVPERRTAVYALLDQLKYLPISQRAARVDELVAALAVDMPKDLMMSTDQVKSLHAAGMDIGGHTCGHPILAKLQVDQARREIGDGKARLEEIIRAPVRLFAYPNGKPLRDYTREHVGIVRDMGFKAAVSTAWGVATGASDRFQLPRFTPWDTELSKFGLRLAGNMLRTSYETV
jgi:peptidoglycan/xylan/chitin deacetylase (PgdA/CDA1 family)